MGQQGFGLDAPGLERLLYDGVCYILGGARRDRRLDQDHAFGLDLLAYYLQAVFQRRNIRVALADVSKCFLLIVALHVDYHHVGKREHFIGVGSDERLFVLHAPSNKRRHFRVFGFDGRNSQVEILDFPK